MNSQDVIEQNIKEYIRKYAIKHKITEEEAKNHILVVIAEEYYRSGKND